MPGNGIATATPFLGIDEKSFQGRKFATVVCDLEAGTVLHVSSWFEITAGNKFNPDPSNPVAFGQRTIDDMSFSWLSWYYLSDDEYRQMLTERQEKSKKLTASR